jgi:chromosome segregation ATPase
MLHEIQEKNKELEIEVQNERKRNSEFSSKYELLEEEHVLFKAQLSTENEKLEAEIKSLKAQITKLKMNEDETQSEKQSLKTKISDLQRKLTEAEIQGNKTSSTIDLEKSRLKSKLDEKEQEYSKLVKQNEMNLDQLSSLRKDVR